MGTLMALGFTRAKVIGLFTLEGFFHGVLAALVAAAYGLPLLAWIGRTGWALPGDVDSYGFAIGDRLFPAYSLGLVAGTTVLVLVVTTVVSFLPTRRIAKLKPTDALRGRLS
jgi:ABC-type lipoprotein release transport system permease subunit